MAAQLPCQVCCSSLPAGSCLPPAFAIADLAAPTLAPSLTHLCFALPLSCSACCSSCSLALLPFPSFPLRCSALSSRLLPFSCCNSSPPIALPLCTAMPLVPPSALARPAPIFCPFVVSAWAGQRGRERGAAWRAAHAVKSGLQQRVGTFGKVVSGKRASSCEHCTHSSAGTPKPRGCPATLSHASK